MKRTLRGLGQCTSGTRSQLQLRLIKLYGLDQNGPEPVNHFTEVATASTQTREEEQSDTSSVPILKYESQSSRSSLTGEDLDQCFEEMSTCSDRLESLEELSSSYGDQNEERDLELALEMSRLVNRLEALEAKIQDSTDQVELRRRVENIEEYLDGNAHHVENSEASVERQSLDDARSQAAGEIFRRAVNRSNQLRKNRPRRYERS